VARAKERNKVKDGIAFTGKSWSYVLRVPDPISGKTKPKWVGGFDTEESALLARDEARVALRKRTYIPPSDRTLGEFISEWLNTVHKSQIKLSTFHNYEKVIRNYIIPGLGGLKLSDLKPTHIQKFYTETLEKPGVSGKPVEPRTVELAGAILKKCLRFAVEVEGVLSFNPASRVPLPKARNSVKTPWSFNELRQFLDFLDTADHRLKFFFRLSAYTGARRGELLALRWSDFDGKAITISKSRTIAGNSVVEFETTKGGKGGRRRVALDDETVELFNAHRKRQIQERLVMGSAWQDLGYVFVQENGTPIDTGTPTHLFRKLTKEAGLRPIRLHDLRHLHATELLRLGEPLHVVSDRLGHKDPMVTATIYAHVTNEQAESASSTFANASRSAV
jgi:integrase